MVASGSSGFCTAKIEEHRAERSRSLLLLLLADWALSLRKVYLFWNQGFGWVDLLTSFRVNPFGETDCRFWKGVLTFNYPVSSYPVLACPMCVCSVSQKKQLRFCSAAS